MIRRVRDRETFRALAGARRHHAGPVSVRAVRTADPGAAAVAYAIGRPVGNAVARNRLRRRLRAIVHSHADLLAPGWAYLLGGSRAAVTLPRVDLERAVVDVLQRTASR